MYTLGFFSQLHIRGEEGGWQMKFKPLLADLSPWALILVMHLAPWPGKYSMLGKALENILNMNFAFCYKCSSNSFLFK